MMNHYAEQVPLRTIGRNKYLEEPYDRVSNLKNDKTE